MPAPLLGLRTTIYEVPGLDAAKAWYARLLGNALAFGAPAVPAGARFDVMFRILNDVMAPTSVILSQCFTVTAL